MTRVPREFKPLQDELAGTICGWNGSSNGLGRDAYSETTWPLRKLLGSGLTQAAENGKNRAQRPSERQQAHSVCHPLLGVKNASVFDGFGTRSVPTTDRNLTMFLRIEAIRIEENTSSKLALRSNDLWQ